MADRTGIEWTDASWNPVVGCSIVSPGCTNCYAMGQAARIVRCSAGLERASTYDGTVATVKGKPVWTGKVALASDATLTQPLRWKRPRRIFVNSMGDLFHEDVPDEWIDRVFAVMALAPQHTFQILTKRSARMRAYFAATWQLPARGPIHIDDTLIVPAQPARTEDRWEQINGAIDDITMDPLFDQDRFWTPEGSLIGRPIWPRQPLPNVWLGVSAEDQRRADERIPDLLATPAAIRFVSAEPLLGPIDFKLPPPVQVHHHPDNVASEALSAVVRSAVAKLRGPMLDWVIVGGESGKGARPMHPDWARAIRDQCAAAGTAFFFKQWGEWQDGSGFAAGWKAVTRDGRIIEPTVDDLRDADREISLAGQNATAMRKVGKARAGRLLDGVTHDAMPEARHD